MDAIFAVTYSCGTACKTCNTWMLKGTMPIDRFRVAWDKLMAAPEITRVLLNGLGDLNTLPDAVEYLRYIESHRTKPVVFTTNAKVIPYVPAVDVYICSFNGGTREAYERTMGLDFDRVQANIRAHYQDFACKVGRAEVHMVVWSGNRGTEEAFGKLWSDFPGRVRLNYRATNIPAKWAAPEELPPAKEPQVYCDNLDVITVQPSGAVELCFCGYSTDFTDLEAAPVFGDIFEDSITALANAPARTRYRAEHCKGIFRHPCDKCNYNVALDRKLVYLKGAEKK